MRLLIIWFLIAGSDLQTHAQDLTQTVRGTVVDQLTQSPLPGATVVLLNSDPVKGTTTNVEGKFRIEDVPIGRQGIKVSFIGYRDQAISNMIVNAHKEIVLNISLEELAIQMEEIVISGRKKSHEVNNDLVAISGRGFNMEETNRYAGSREDPSRMVANYAGVSGANDARNDIIVRGNSPLGVLWRLDDIDIPNPNHFSTQGATGGPISILNNNLLDRSDFITGAFPAEYGNKTAAVFDLQMRTGNDENYEFASQFGMNGLELMTEGPINKQSRNSFLASYRYSTLFIFDWLDIDIGAPALPEYQDLTFKFNFPTKKFGIFSVLGMGGKSKISIIDSERKETGTDLAAEAEKGYDLNTGSEMGVLGLGNKHLFSKNTYGKFTLALTGSNFIMDTDFIVYDSITNEQIDKYNTYHNSSVEGNVNLKYTLNHKINSKHFIKGGFNLNNLIYDLNEKSRYRIIRDSKGSTQLMQSYFHWQWKINALLSTNFGLNYMYLTLNEKQAIEPRFGLKYSLSERSDINIGFGVHNQMQPLYMYFLETEINNETFLTNKELDFTNSLHGILGYSYAFGDNWLFKTETYYQILSKLPVEGARQSTFSAYNAGTSYEGVPDIDSLKSTGSGRTYGIELTIERTFSKGFYFLHNVSLFKSDYTGSDNVWRSSAFANGFIINLIGGTEFRISKKKHKILVSDLKITYAGGKRYTPIDFAASTAAGLVRYVEEETFEKQYDPYNKVDLKVGFRSNYKRVTITWYITVENIFNRENVLTEIYNPRDNKVE
ncbi:TonB-dependent receptor, partial [Bacteroidales bacterium AH-315-N07]|nr:TonB-dependent receptor [Bacteroidales bacterium AH-315-N07]